MNGYLDKFLTWISLHLPKEALNALRKIQFTIGTNFWNTLYVTPWNQSNLRSSKDFSNQFHSKQKALVFNETSITAQPFPLVKSTEKSTQTLLCLSWPDVSAIYVSMFLNSSVMWNIRLFPEPFGTTIKKSWPLTNPSTIFWLSVISLKPSFLSYQHQLLRAYAHFLLFHHCLYFKAKCLPREGLAWIKFPENWPHKKKRFLIGYP